MVTVLLKIAYLSVLGSVVFLLIHAIPQRRPGEDDEENSWTFPWGKKGGNTTNSPCGMDEVPHQDYSPPDRPRQRRIQWRKQTDWSPTALEANLLTELEARFEAARWSG